MGNPRKQAVAACWLLRVKGTSRSQVGMSALTRLPHDVELRVCLWPGGRYGPATSLSLEVGDLMLLPGQLPPEEQAVAIPPGLIFLPAQEHLGVHALRVGFVS